MRKIDTRALLNQTTVLAIALVLCSGFASQALADDVVMFNYVVEEELGAADITTSEFGMLVHFDKDASADIGDTAKLDMRALDLGDKVRVTLRLQDYLSDELVEVGQGSIEVPFGGSRQISWHDSSGRYSVQVSPTRHSM